MVSVSIIVIAHNIRSAHNVGSIFRTAEGFGASQIICSGYTPYPTMHHDKRLPHIRDKISAQIHKTALGAEQLVSFEYQQTPDIASLRSQGYTIAGLEQTSSSISLNDFRPPEKIALVLGEEVNGISTAILEVCDTTLEIPMFGQKESFNVSVACGIALYHLRVFDRY